MKNEPFNGLHFKLENKSCKSISPFLVENYVSESRSCHAEIPQSFNGRVLVATCSFADLVILRDNDHEARTRLAKNFGKLEK